MNIPQTTEPMRVAVLGAGYVGLVSGAGLAAIGHRVVCADLNQERVDAVNAGKAPFHEPGLEELLAESLADGRMSATTDVVEALRDSEVSIIAVGTPSGGGDIDLSWVEGAATTIGEQLSSLPAGHVVVVKSTVVPGTTEDVVGAAVLKASGMPRDSFGLATNPEFLREGCAVEDFMNPDRIVIGASDTRAGEVLSKLYSAFDCPKPIVTPATAELTKYTSNSLLATLISFSNEIARFCETIPGTDVDAVLDGVHLDRRLTPREGQRMITPQILSYLRAGAGYGGSCLPKDVEALRANGRKRGVPTPLLDAVVDVNSGRAADMIAMVEKEIGALDGRPIAVLGLAFKPGTDDLRDSPALRMISLLREKGAEVRAFDPMIAAGSRAAEGVDAEVRAELADTVNGADAAILMTAWPEFAEADWTALSGAMANPLLVDGRNQLRHHDLPAALRYLAAGRSVD